MLFKHILVFNMKTSLYSYLSSMGAIFQSRNLNILKKILKS